MRDGGVGTSKSSPAITAVRTLIRTVVEGPDTDRYLSPEIEAVRLLTNSGQVLEAANEALGAELL